MIRAVSYLQLAQGCQNDHDNMGTCGLTTEFIAKLHKSL